LRCTPIRTESAEVHPQVHSTSTAQCGSIASASLKPLGSSRTMRA
jgi:hypothetical protein